MANKETGKPPCGQCSCGDTDMYWCEYCNKASPEKRCPTCGLKLKKMKK